MDEFKIRFWSGIRWAYQPIVQYLEKCGYVYNEHMFGYRVPWDTTYLVFKKENTYNVAYKKLQQLTGKDNPE